MTWLLFITEVLGQQRDTIFIDKYTNQTSKDKACYFLEKDQVTKVNGKWKWIQNMYYLNNVLAENCPIELDNVKTYITPKRNGICRSYYENAALESISTYKKGHKVGEYKEFYKNGNLKSSGKNDRFMKKYMYTYYDSTGKQLLNKGTGKFIVVDDSITYHYSIKDSVMSILKYYHKELKDTVYNYIDMPVAPLIGWNRFYKAMQKAEVWENETKKYRGMRLIIEFAVFEDGKIGYIRKLNTIDQEMDNIILENIKKKGAFNPPMLKSGKKVKTLWRIPLLLIG